MSVYSELLKDDRWKSKRLEILKRDGYQCVYCNITEKLQVHHIKYTGKPWEAPNEDLVTLCNNCHKKLHSSDLKTKPLLSWKNTMNVTFSLSEELVQGIVEEHIAKVVFNPAKHWNKELSAEVKEIILLAVREVVNETFIKQIIQTKAEEVAKEMLKKELELHVAKNVKQFVRDAINSMLE